jgi:hypothetical protein
VAEHRPDPAGTDDDIPAVEEPAAENVSEDNPEGHLDTALPPRMNDWRRRSAAGAMLTGFAFGLREVFELPHQEPSIEIQTSGDPPTDLPVDAEVDQIRPADNVVTVRPWLLPDGEPTRDESGLDPETGTEPPPSQEPEDESRP